MVKRFASFIKVKPEKLEEYKKIHKNVWPEIIKINNECNIGNFSIYEKDNFLFSYFEYTGNNFEKDMEIKANSPIINKWINMCKPLLIPLKSRKEGELWASTEEIFHLD